jgi:hypothetical protein
MKRKALDGVQGTTVPAFALQSKTLSRAFLALEGVFETEF